MKHSLIAVAAIGAGAMLTTSCTQDELVLRNQDEIRFSVSAASPSRAAESFCNASLPNDFTLWAQTSDENHTPYISDAAVNRINGTYYDFADGDHRYWPADGNLDFIAVHGDEFTFNGDLSNPQFVNFRVQDNPARQYDLIYAVNTNVGKTADAVPLNFRHALSQVVFSAKVTNEFLQVEIDSITIGHLKNQGTFSFSPSETTSQTWLDGGHNSAAVESDHSNSGQWSDLVGLASYGIKTVSNSIKEQTGAVRLSYVPDEHKNTLTPTENLREVLNLIPQSQEAWVPIPNAAFNGTYVGVKCRIYSIEGGDKVILNPDQEWTYIPTAVNWEPGVRYVYTLDFGHGNAGYASPFEGGQETLTPIDLEVTADDIFDSGYSALNWYGVTFYVPEGMARWNGLDSWGHYTTATSDSIPMPYGPTIPNDNFQPFTECEFAGWVSWEYFNDRDDNGNVDIAGSSDRIDVNVAGKYNAQHQRIGSVGPNKPGTKKDVYKYGNYSFYACWKYKFNFKVDFHLDDFWPAEKLANGYSRTYSASVTARTIQPWDLQCDSVSAFLAPYHLDPDKGITGPEDDIYRVPTGYRLLGFSAEYKPYLGQNLTEEDCDWVLDYPITNANNPLDNGTRKKDYVKITLPWGREARGNYTIHAVWGPDPDYVPAAE